ncbi:DEAD/DEAH box helicase [Herbidospora yilanensis]|uniref:DEAD/DEAH box helicase n=1 Tax=Herbidospora yilanensis TaxID=354426 RepID=UPI001E56B407|nr:DEAD/DEAH box helicase [Herbidospora yilanensis]
MILGADDLLAFLSYGNRARLERARSRLRMVAVGDAGPEEVNTRWVASHLLALADEAEAGSPWSPEILPPTIPKFVRQAFTMGSPPVLVLWEPQRELLRSTPSPFDPLVKRMVLSVPTSGGKTLLAQMIAIEHLARTDMSVCYVAPTRSLCREVRRSMAVRVHLLQKEAGSDQTEFPLFSDIFDLLQEDEPADVEVMTPERLFHLLRHNPNEVMDRFGLFIFDESQLLKESKRGFTLEAVIALLSDLSRDSEHRIILISAAMGNASSIATWLNPEGSALLYQSEWRGPRRLHAAFTTSAEWPLTRWERVPRGKKWPYRRSTPLTGLIRLRLADGKTARLTTRGSTGWTLVRKADQPEGGVAEKDSVRSTKQYVIASQMIARLGHAGSALLVTRTRDQAQQLARALAREFEENPAMGPLVDFVRLQIGDAHPLIETLKRGVGFHHAGLPVEVQEALEDALREDVLPYLTCTSTLTEGINLPVRTVVIYDQGYEGQHTDAQLRGARLINAMGRAGRAGKETEGWIVLVRAAEPSEADFSDLAPDPDKLAVTSSLATESALEAFASLEQSLRLSDDSLLQQADTITSSFISYVWLMLSIKEGSGEDPGSLNMHEIVDLTLAAAQSNQSRSLCLSVADAVQRVYLRSPIEGRRRWPRTGTSIPSAQIIDRIATQLAQGIFRDIWSGDLWNISTPLGALQLLEDSIATLLDLPEAPQWRFRVTSRGEPIVVQAVEVLRDWVSGASLPSLAEKHLRSAKQPEWRIEQMVDAVTDHFEHYLSWTLSALVELVNIRLEEAEVDHRLCPELGGHIRYGVQSPAALILMTSGIRSRRLANYIASDLPIEVEAARESLRDWLASIGITEWRTRYSATASEVLDLLEFTRLRRRSLLRTLLETGNVDVAMPTAYRDLPFWDGELEFKPKLGEEYPAPLALYGGDEFIVTVAAADQVDLSAIIETGLEITIEMIPWSDPPTVRISLPFSEVYE